MFLISDGNGSETFNHGGKYRPYGKQRHSIWAGFHNHER